jgi:hypothetical protein
MRRVSLIACAAILALPPSPSAAQQGSGLPLQPARTIQFTTDEATWISLDVSPDGRTIVFDVLGDLYTIPITGGTATRITSGMAFDGQPRFSPDGEQLVFTSDRDGWMNVWISDKDGRNPRPLTQFKWGNEADRVSSPVWRPDGLAIIASERVGGGPGSKTRLIEIDIASRTIRPITSASATDNRIYLGAYFGKSADTVFAAVREPEGSTGTNWQIARIPLKSGKTYWETNVPSGLTALRPTVSRDGRYIVYGAQNGEGTGLRVLDRQTSEERWLVRSAQRDVLAWAVWDSRDVLPGSSFTPDGSAVITSYGGKIWRVEIATANATQIPFKVDVEQQLGPLVRAQHPFADEPIAARAVRDPQLSPDGTKMAFVLMDRIWIADLPRSRAANKIIRSGDGDRKSSTIVTPRRLTNSTHGEFSPSWSPDGQSVVYVTWSDANGGGVSRMRADGTGKPERLAGDTLVYFKTAFDANRRILVMRAAHRVWRTTELEGRSRTENVLELVRLDPDVFGMTRVKGISLSSRPGLEEKHSVAGYGRPHAVEGNRIAIFRSDSNVVAWLTPDGASAGRSMSIEWDSARFGTPAIEAIVAPNGRQMIMLRGGSFEPVLLSWSGPAPEKIRVKSNDSIQLTNGLSFRQLARRPAIGAGWNAQGIPYYVVGGSFYVGTKAPTRADDPELGFNRFDIDVKIPADRPRGTLLLRNARIITMRGNEVIENGDILVRNGRVYAVGKRGAVTVPMNAEIIDVTGKTIVPGFIDVHSHLGPYIAWDVHPEQDWRLNVELAFGVTTIRDPVGYSFDLMALQEREVAGELVSPRIYSVWPIVGMGMFGNGADKDRGYTQDVMRLWSEFYRTETIKQYEAGGRRTRQLIVMAAREQGITPTNEGGWSTSKDLTMAIDGYSGIEHTIPASPQFNDVVQLLAKSGTIVDPTIHIDKGWKILYRRYDPWADGRMTRFVPEADRGYLKERNLTMRPTIEVEYGQYVEYNQNYNKVMKAGGCIAMGAHGNLPGYGPHWEMWSFALGGMSNHDVLRTGTICSARQIGHERDLGSLEVGKIADLVVLDGNPLEKIENTASTFYVMKGGRLYDAATLDEVWPRKKRFFAYGR